MKYLKLFENSSFNQKINTIDSFNDLLREMKPYIFWKYQKLAKDPDYFPDWGQTPDSTINSIDQLGIIGADSMRDGSIDFTLVDYGHEGEMINTYYVNLTEEELEQAKIDMESKKYNI